MSTVNYAGTEAVTEIVKWAKEYTAEKRLEAYPVGSVIFSPDANYDPNDVIGGTWKNTKSLTTTNSFGDGQTISGKKGGFYPRMMGSSNLSLVKQFVDVDDVGWTKLTVDKLPAHTHTVTAKAASGSEVYVRSGYSDAWKYGSSYSETVTTSFAGGGGDGKTIHMQPPYIAMNCWYRVS